MSIYEKQQAVQFEFAPDYQFRISKGNLVMGALAEELKRVGYINSAERLMQTAIEAITQAGPRNWDGSRDLFYQKLKHDADLMWELFAPYRQHAVHALLTKANEQIREMERQRVAAEPSARGQSTDGDQSLNAPRASVFAIDRARAAVASKATIARKSVLDTFVINGQPIGRLTAVEARKWAGAHKIKVRFIELLTANLPDNRLIDELVRPEEAEKIYKQATAETADAL